MDEIWQRHKAFILQVVTGGIVLLIALVVMSNVFSGSSDDPAELQRVNKNNKDKLDKMVREKQAPSAASIAEQKRRADSAEAQIRSMASEVASLASGDAYVRENLTWIANVIGKGGAEVEAWMNLYKNLPQTCLSKVREEVRSALVGRSAQLGRDLDETMGLVQGYDDEDIPVALHGLAIVAEVVDRAFAVDVAGDGKKVVSAVADLRIQPRNALNPDLAWIYGFRVHVSFTGDPDAVTMLKRSFNSLDNRQRRMIVLEEQESLLRPRREEDEVKVQLQLMGLVHRGVNQ
ncbi:MAG: hypothetical protein HMLKMBBP_01346 [Planctomycetes bacterium]|nr:hypothetical protein [Planctomycetota bacterium]